MNILRKINFIFVIVAICASFYHFFIDSIELAMDIILSFLTLLVLYNGIEYFKREERKLGYTYIITGIVIFSGIDNGVIQKIYLNKLVH